MQSSFDEIKEDLSVFKLIFWKEAYNEILKIEIALADGQLDGKSMFIMINLDLN